LESSKIKPSRTPDTTTTMRSSSRPVLPTTTTTTTFLLLILAIVASRSTLQASHDANATAGSSCLPREREALLAFKQGITGDPAGRLASWGGLGGDEDCCRWTGVRCSNRTGTGHLVVVAIRLAGNQLDAIFNHMALSGQISPSVVSLHQLEHLDLSMNNISWPAGEEC